MVPSQFGRFEERQPETAPGYRLTAIREKPGFSLGGETKTLAIWAGVAFLLFLAMGVASKAAIDTQHVLRAHRTAATLNEYNAMNGAAWLFIGVNWLWWMGGFLLFLRFVYRFVTRS